VQLLQHALQRSTMALISAALTYALVVTALQAL
jgi:hypothetical protein